MALVKDSVLNADEGEFIFFPETALIFDKEEMQPWISDLERQATQMNISLISGIFAKDLENPDSFERYNRIQGFGATEGHYDKINLVPFGEFIPLKDYLGKILDIIC